MHPGRVTEKGTHKPCTSVPVSEQLPPMCTLLRSSLLTCVQRCLIRACIPQDNAAVPISPEPPPLQTKQPPCPWLLLQSKPSQRCKGLQLQQGRAGDAGAGITRAGWKAAELQVQSTLWEKHHEPSVEAEVKFPHLSAGQAPNPLCFFIVPVGLPSLARCCTLSAQGYIELFRLGAF